MRLVCAQVQDFKSHVLRQYTGEILWRVNIYQGDVGCKP